MRKFKIKDKKEFLSDVCDIVLKTLIPKDLKRINISHSIIEDNETNHTHHFDCLKNEEVKIKINPSKFYDDLYNEIDVFLLFHHELKEDKFKIENELDDYEKNINRLANQLKEDK